MKSKQASTRRRRSNPPKIRPLALTDLPAVVTLGRKLFTEETLPVLFRTWDELEATGFFLNDGEFCLVATSGRRIVGFALASWMEKGGEPAESYGWLHWIGVAHGHRRSGLAGRMIEELSGRFRRAGARFLLADSDAGNSAALAFFAGRGFRARTRHVFLARELTRPDA